MFALRRDAAGFAKEDGSIAGWMDLEGGSGGHGESKIISAGADGFALVAFAPETPVETIARALDKLGHMQRPSYGGAIPLHAASLFRRVVLSPARATFDGMRPPI